MARIAFFQNISYPYMGTMYLSAALKSKGHEVEVFFKNDGANAALVKEALGNFKPDIAAFSVTTGNHKWALEMARLVKEASGKKIVVLFGGPHPTFYPETINNEGVDAICIGEGEEAIVEFADAVSLGKSFNSIANIRAKDENGKVIENAVRPLQKDIDQLLFPDRALYFKKYPQLCLSRQSFITSRGCPYTCSYCFNKSMMRIYEGKGPYVRLRSPENIIREIERAKDEYNLKTVYFQDDLFAIQWETTEQLLDLYRERIGLQFVCLTRIELLTAEKLRKLKSSGCKRIFWGIESGNERIRRDILKRAISNQVIEEKARLMHDAGIKFRTYNMLGIPRETLEEAFQTLSLNIEIGVDYPWCSLLTPYPRTEIAETVEKEYGATLDENSFESTFFKTQNAFDPTFKAKANLQKLFILAARFPVLVPVFRRLIRLRPNIVFDLMFLFSYAWSIRGSELLTIGDIIKLAKSNIRSFFFSRL